MPSGTDWQDHAERQIQYDADDDQANRVTVAKLSASKNENDFLFALHRVWTLKPQERRMERIASPNVADRIITNGCINVQNNVYEKLRQYFILEII